MVKIEKSIKIEKVHFLKMPLTGASVDASKGIHYKNSKKRKIPYGSKIDFQISEFSSKNYARGMKSGLLESF